MTGARAAQKVKERKVAGRRFIMAEESEAEGREDNRGAPGSKRRI